MKPLIPFWTDRALWRALPALVAVAVTATLAAGDAWAASATAPPAGLPSKKSGLVVRAEAGGQAWFGRFGYHPVRFTVTAAKPAPGDRLITVRLYTGRMLQPPDQLNYDMAVEQDAKLPAGRTEVSFDMLVPTLDRQQYALWWEVWVDGRRDIALSPPVQPTQANYNVTGVSVLRPPRSRVGGQETREAPANLDLPFAQQDTTRSPLPREWLRYTSRDVVVLTLEELRTARQETPEALAALRRWVNAGGNLVVEGLGASFGTLDEVSETLEMSRDPILPLAPSEDSDPAPGDAGPRWRWATIRPEHDDSMPIAMRGNGTAAPAVAPETRAWFAEANLGFGRVVAYRGGWLEEPRGRPPTESSMMLTQYWNARSWSARHGLVPDEYNNDFANWLIPGVGLAPLTAFRVLVTMFVLVVGPLSYFVLRAYGRTQLLALTAPVLSALFTLCLFAYATLADGFGTQTRVRSLSIVDQPRGEAVTWGRHTYYSGLAPADGLTLPRSAAVYPIQPGAGDGVLRHSEVAQRELLWQSDAARLASGWLPSREIMQYLIVNAGPCEAQVTLTRQGAALYAENLLGADLERLYVRDESGDWFRADALAVGGQEELTPVDRTEAASELRALMLTNEPEFPAGLGPNASGGVLAGARSSRQYGTVACGDSLLNELMDRISGAQTGDPLPLAPRAYLAISRETTVAPLGLESVRENGSFHVTVGRW